jgi:hypothetical protein
MNRAARRSVGRNPLECGPHSIALADEAGHADMEQRKKEEP